MTLVIDASVALKWFLQEQGSDAAARLLDSADLLIAPELIIAEVCNAGWKAVRTGTAVAMQLESAASRLPVVLDELVPLAGLAAPAVAIAQALDHPVHDCFYLALAEQREASLPTADKRLIGRVTGTDWTSGPAGPPAARAAASLSYQVFGTPAAAAGLRTTRRPPSAIARLTRCRRANNVPVGYQAGQHNR